MFTLTKREKPGSVSSSTYPLRPDIEHWWAVEAMIASYNHVYQVTYKTTYEVHGPVGVSIYDGAPIASFHYEFLALSADAPSVIQGIRNYPVRREKQYVLDVFHPEPSDHDLKQQYVSFGYEFVRTGPILGWDVSEQTDTAPTNIYKATTLKQAEIASQSLITEGERIHLETLWDSNIHSYYITENGEAVGWLQLVTVYPEVGYINQLYVLEAYRKRKLGTLLVEYAQTEALRMGLKKVILIPSDMAIPLYRRLGYRPLLYFSAFRPKYT